VLADRRVAVPAAPDDVIEVAHDATTPRKESPQELLPLDERLVAHVTLEGRTRP